MAISTVSAKGQITLPAKARHLLGIKPRDKVQITVRDDAIVIERIGDFFELEGFLGKALPADDERAAMARGGAGHVATFNRKHFQRLGVPMLEWQG